jgi:hypothetical protein
MTTSPMNVPPTNSPPIDTRSTDAANGRPVPSDPEELRRDIAETRERLGDTVEALTHKMDVKAQARERMAAGRESARESADEARARVARLYEARPSVVLGAACAAVCGLIAWLIVRRRR